MNKILIIHHGALGDTLCAWPVFVALADAFAGQKKYFIGGGNLAFLLKPLGFAPCPDSLAALERAFYEPQIQIATNDTAVFRFCLDKRPPFVPPGALILKALPKAETHVSVALGKAAAKAGLSLPSAVEAAARFRALHGLLPSRQSKKIAIFSGAGHKMKQWPPAKFAALAENFMRSGYEPLQIMGPQEVEQGHDLRQYLPGLATTITESMADLLQALGTVRLAVGNDSGPMHLAALAGVPAMTIFGPTSPARWHPVGEWAEYIAKAMPCSPCTIKADHFACNHPICLEGLTVNDVWSRLKKNFL